MGVDVVDCCFITHVKAGYRLTWEATQYCPYECEYCFTWSSPERLKFETDVAELINRLKLLVESLEVEDVLITGGEPLAIIDEIAPFLTYLNDHGISFSFSTTLYNRELSARLCEFGPRAVNLSIDPSAVGKQQRSAFKAEYQTAIGKLAILRDAGIPIKTTAVITRHNLSGVPSLLDFLNQQLASDAGIAKVAFNREYPIGHAAPSQPLSRNELESTFERLRDWSAEITVPVKLVNWSEFHDPLQDCPAGYRLISVMQNGDVTPCSLLYNISRAFKVGNLLHHPPELLKYRLETFHRDLQRYNAKTELNTPRCATCDLTAQCHGGCLAALPIASNRIVERTCSLSPTRAFDPQRVLLKDLHNGIHASYTPKKRRTHRGKPPEIDTTVEERIRAFVVEQLHPTDLAHNLEHIESVVAIARYISKRERASTRITIPAAFLHDIAPREPAMHYLHTFKSANFGIAFLASLNVFGPEELDHIQSAIVTSSFGGHILGLEPQSLEARVVRDADLLDAIGARGIARVFAFNQAHGGRTMGYPAQDPEGPLDSVDTNIIGPDESPIDHFYKKLLRVRDIILTPTGRLLAESRHEFMVSFLKKYRQEIEEVRRTDEENMLFDPDELASI